MIELNERTLDLMANNNQMGSNHQNLLTTLKTLSLEEVFKGLLSLRHVSKDKIHKRVKLTHQKLVSTRQSM